MQLAKDYGVQIYPVDRNIQHLSMLARKCHYNLNGLLEADNWAKSLLENQRYNGNSTNFKRCFQHAVTDGSEEIQ